MNSQGLNFYHVTNDLKQTHNGNIINGGMVLLLLS